MKILKTAASIFAVFCITAVCAAAAPAAEEPAAVYPKVKVGGFARVRADWALTDSSTPTMSVPNARIEIKAFVSDDAFYAFSMDSSSGTLKLFDSYFDLQFMEWFNMRLGQFKYNFGREQAISDANLELINKSYAASDLVSPTREIGAEFSRTFKNAPLRPFVAVGGFNGAGPNAAAQNSYGAGTARLRVSPADGLIIGASLYDGKIAAAKVTKTRRGFEAAYENRSALAIAEHIAGRDGTTDKGGYYLTAGYCFFGDKAWKRPYALLLARYDYYDDNEAVPDTELSRTTLGTVFQRDEHVSMRLNYEMINEKPSIPNDLWTWQFQVKF